MKVVSTLDGSETDEDVFALLGSFVPMPLVKKLAELAERRGTTLARLVVTAIENEVSEEPPQWFVNEQARRSRASARKS